MDQYLLQILKETNTIIIPDLGALTITNPVTGEIMFMPFLKHDDGKLSSYISEKEGIEENEAKNIIAKHVREIKSKLDQGEPYSMFEFGTFSKNEDGDIEFTNWDKGSDTSAPEQPKEETTAAKEVPVEEKKEPVKEEKPVEVKKAEAEKPKKEEPKKEEVPETPEKKIEKPEPEVVKPEAVEKKEPVKKESKPTVEKKEEKKPEPVKKEAPTPKKEAPVVPISQGNKEKNILEKEEIAANQKKLDNLKKEKENKDQKKKRGVGFYLLITLIVIIIGGGVTIGIFYDDVKQHIPFLAEDTKTEQAEEPSEMDKMKEMLGEEGAEENTSPVEGEEAPAESKEAPEEEMTEQVEEAAPVEEEKPVVAPTVNNSANNQDFHIIAGAFSSPDNASKLATKLQGMGYPAKTFPRGAMTMVSVQSYPSAAEAQAALSTVKNDVPGGWILKWSN